MGECVVEHGIGSCCGSRPWMRAVTESTRLGHSEVPRHGSTLGGCPGRVVRDHPARLSSSRRASRRWSTRPGSSAPTPARRALSGRSRARRRRRGPPPGTAAPPSMKRSPAITASRRPRGDILGLGATAAAPRPVADGEDGREVRRPEQVDAQEVAALEDAHQLVEVVSCFRVYARMTRSGCARPAARSTALSMKWGSGVFCLPERAFVPDRTAPVSRRRLSPVPGGRLGTTRRP